MTLPFIISIPHCSANVPEAIGKSFALNHRQIVESVDYGTEEIFGRLPAQKTVRAQWSRLVADPNRSPTQTDAKGVLALTDYHGRPIYRPGMEPDSDTVARRVKRYHRPYHDQLAQALYSTTIVGLIDGHSLNAIGPADAPDPGQKRKDITLSNNGDILGRERPGHGPATCSKDQIRLFKQCFEEQGFSVSLNHPYKGGYIINHYKPLMASAEHFAIQIEMNQNLYMHPDSTTPEPPRIHATGQKVLMAFQKISAVLLEGEVL